MPSAVSRTALPGRLALIKALRPSMLAKASGSGLTCETRTTSANGSIVAKKRSERDRRSIGGGAGSAGIARSSESDKERFPLTPLLV